MTILIPIKVKAIYKSQIVPAKDNSTLITFIGLIHAFIDA